MDEPLTLTRRATALGVGALSLTGCSRRDSYAEAVAATWRLAPATGGFPVQALVHAGTLAANSHNTQAWRFLPIGQRIRIAPDLSRRTPAVDPDDHHLFVSLGCAAETMLQAAGVYGWSGAVEAVDVHGGVTLAFTPSLAGPGPLAAAIARRASTRSTYDGRPASAQQLRDLAQAVGGEVGVSLITDRKRLAEATDFIVQGDRAQLRDEAFRRELKSWIRFSADEALARGDGLFAASSGSPTMPRLVGERLFDLAFTDKGETDKIVRQMRSSAGLAVFASAAGGPSGWVEAGRAFTRFALTATAAGLKLAFLNQPVEDGATRPGFARWLGAVEPRPDLVVRFGHGPDLPRSLRRPLSQVLAA
jgi:hypothetical protein